jgi:heme/copper-type cytochrome/quinol oxidase subunit 3
MGNDTPPGSATLGLRFFLAALTMFFGAGMVLYVAVRTGRLGQFSGPTDAEIAIPGLFWFSTFVILGASVLLEGAVLWSRGGGTRGARRFVLGATALSYLFLILQIPGSIFLLRAHRAGAEEGMFLYGLVLVLVVLHGLHVVGGLIPLTMTAVRSSSGATDALDPLRLRHLATYFHFLTIVWLVMFNVFLLAG